MSPSMMPLVQIFLQYTVCQVNLWCNNSHNILISCNFISSSYILYLMYRFLQVYFVTCVRPSDWTIHNIVFPKRYQMRKIKLLVSGKWPEGNNLWRRHFTFPSIVTEYALFWPYSGGWPFAMIPDLDCPPPPPRGNVVCCNSLLYTTSGLNITWFDSLHIDSLRMYMLYSNDIFRASSTCFRNKKTSIQVGFIKIFSFLNKTTSPGPNRHA